MTLTRQIPLDLPVRAALGREDFLVSEGNALAVAQIDGWRDWPGRRLALVGPEGAGKTHLAAVWAQEAFFDRVMEEDEDEREPLTRLNVSEMAVREAEHIIGGALFETDLDISHPLGFGYNDRTLPVQRNMTSVLIRPEDDPYAVVAEYTDEPLLSGYASERRQGEIAGTPAVDAERLGRGSVIMMADNPVFRATFPGSERLLMNAIFFSDMIDGARGVYAEE